MRQKKGAMVVFNVEVRTQQITRSISDDWGKMKQPLRSCNAVTKTYIMCSKATLWRTRY